MFGEMKIFYFVEILFAIEFVCLFAQINDCDQGIKVDIENQDEFCAQNESVIQISVTTTNIELKCPMDFAIGILNQPAALQIGHNTILNENSITIQVMRYGHSGIYNCTENANPSNVLLIEIQATGVGMIIRDRKTPGPGFSIEFHQVLNSSVVYLACDRDIGIVFICESSYNNERFNINSDTTVSSSSQQNINEFEIGNNGEISDGGNQFVLTCQPKDENGNIQTLSITAMLTERLPDENCDDIFPRTPESNDNYQACLLEIGITSYPEIIPCINCIPIWTKTNGICYNVFKEGNPTTWNSAQENCMAFGGYLAEIPNYFVQTIITQEVNSDCWIGLRRNGTAEEFRWRSGRELGEFNFWKDEMEPVNSDCVSLMGAMSEWNTRSCDNTISCFICMLGSIYPPPMPIPQIGCNNGQVINGRCYQVINVQLSWQRAQLECELLGSNLIEITNEIIYNQLMNSFPESEPYWIGLRLNSMTNMYEWRSGIMFNDSFVKWQNADPSINNGNNNCVVAFGNGFWELRPCDVKLRYICQNATTVIPTTTSPSININTKVSSTLISTTISPSITNNTNFTSTLISTTISPSTNNTINISENKTENCSSNTNLGSLCTLLEESVMEAQTGTLIGVSLLLQREEILEELVSNVNVTTGITLFLFISQNIVVVITRVSVNKDTTIPLYRNSLQIGTDSFPDETTFVILVDENPTNTSATLISDVITIFASNELIGELLIVFQIGNEIVYEKEQIQCVFLDKNTKEWSTEGLTEVFGVNGSVICITNHLTTFAVLFSTASPCDRDPNDIGRIILMTTSYTLLSISLLFLLTSVIIFMLSGKRFFSLDVNKLHFNHALSLFLAVASFLFLVGPVWEHLWLCSIVAFLLHFLWTNVFISSLSIAILVFYSIWIVSIQHTARKLYKYLIPIDWCVSLLWAVVWLVYGQLTGDYLDIDVQNETTDKNCEYYCFLSSKKHLIWSFLAPIYAILALNALLLFLCLYKIRLALRNKNSYESELSRLRRVSFGAILLIPALGLPFIMSIPLSFYLKDDSLYAVFEWVFVLSNAPVGIVHFLLITYQIPEAKIPKYCRSIKSQQPTTSMTDSSIAKDTLNRKPSLHFNVVHLLNNNNKDATVYCNDWVETRL